MLRFLLLSFLLPLLTPINGQNMSLPDLLAPDARDPEQEVQSRPGIKARWTKKGLDYVCHVGVQALAYKMNELRISDFQEEVGGPGKGKISGSNLKILGFKPLKIWYALEPSQQMRWGTTEGEITVSGDWAAKYKAFIAIKGQGSFTVSAKELEFTMGVRFGITPSGKPKLIPETCSVNLGELKVRIKGGIVGWLVSRFRKKIESTVRKLLDAKLCEQAKLLISEKANEELASLPVYTSISPMFLMDNVLMTAPQVTNQYVEAPLKGEITFLGQGKTPFDPPPLPEKNATDRMLYIWASDYVVNSLISGAYRNRLLIFAITAANSPDLAPYLRTTCPAAENCFGQTFAALRNQYPNKTIEIYMSAMEQPTVKLNRARAVMRGKALGQMYVELDNGTAVHLVSFWTTFHGTMQILVQDSRIRGILRIIDINVNVTKSTIGRFSKTEIDLFMMLAGPFFEGYINTKLKAGIPIPRFKNLQFVAPEVVFNDRAIEIQSDVQFMHFEMPPGGETAERPELSRG